MADVVLRQEVPAVDPAPGVHHKVASPGKFARVKDFVVVFFIFRKSDIPHDQIIGLFVIPEAVMVCLDKIKLVCGGDVVKIFKHGELYVVIRLHNADIFSLCPVDAGVHGFSIAAVRLVYEDNAAVFGCIFLQDGKAVVRRSVVHADDLDIGKSLPHNALHAFSQIFTDVVGGNNDRYFWHVVLLLLSGPYTSSSFLSVSH